MDIQLITSNFKPTEALEILTEYIHTAINFYEKKLEGTKNEEKQNLYAHTIRELQKNLFEAGQLIANRKSVRLISGLALK